MPSRKALRPGDDAWAGQLFAVVEWHEQTGRWPYLESTDPHEASAGRWLAQQQTAATAGKLFRDRLYVLRDVLSDVQRDAPADGRSSDHVVLNVPEHLEPMTRPSGQRRALAPWAEWTRAAIGFRRLQGAWPTPKELPRDKHCPICGRRSVSVDQLGEHLRRAHKTNFTQVFGSICPLCRSPWDNLGAHMHTKVNHPVVTIFDAFLLAERRGDPHGVFEERRRVWFAQQPPWRIRGLCRAFGCPEVVGVGRGPWCDLHEGRRAHGADLHKPHDVVGERLSGFGRFGIVDRDEHGVLCHDCGLWFTLLSSHLRHAHETTVADYRARHGLAATAPLCSFSFSRARASEAAAQMHADTEAWRTFQAAGIAIAPIVQPLATAAAAAASPGGRAQQVAGNARARLGRPPQVRITPQTKWDQQWREVLDFRRAHDRWPADASADGDLLERRLTGWITNQRKLFRNEKLPQDRREAMEAAGLAMNPGYGRAGTGRHQPEPQWLVDWDKVQEFRRRHDRWPLGTAADAEERRLRYWIGRQRLLARDGRLLPSRRAALLAGGMELTPKPGPAPSAIEPRL